MHQVTLGGSGMKSLPLGQQGGYIKLLLKQPGLLGMPMMRTYTIRTQREGEIDVQFALHGEQAAGLATKWAQQAKPGDTIMVGGPGPAKPFFPDHDFYLAAGDMSALPAIAANLEALPADARGMIALEIQHEDDAVPLAKPDGIDIEWIVNPHPGTQPRLLADALRAVELPQGHIAGWAACEFSAMKELRAFLREQLGLGPRSLYISSYWKLGINEGEHKKVKQQDAMAQPA
jgi:NADPH-dependent ferric siderophore reductase